MKGLISTIALCFCLAPVFASATPYQGQGFTIKDGTDGMSGLSLVTALSSFSGDGVGVGASGAGDTLEISIGAGFDVDGAARFVIGATLDKQGREMVSVGFGWSF